MPMTQFAQLIGKRACVTGASSGIGRAIALELARAGADVAIHYRQSMGRAEQTAEEIRRLGRSCELFSADLSQAGVSVPFVEQVWSKFGHCDVWVHNAGVDLLTGDGPSLSFSRKLQLLLQVDVTATMEITREVGHRMKQAGAGSIVTIGWDQADRGMEGDSAELFSAAKNAVMGFSRSLAVSLAPEVRVNCIAPGWIRTSWGEQASEVWQERVVRETPLRRWGEPQDIATLARFLVSPEASYITGQVINANGGAVR